MWERAPAASCPQLNAETYNNAKIVARGLDVHYLDQEWRDFWVDSGMPVLHHPDKAFIVEGGRFTSGLVRTHLKF